MARVNVKTAENLSFHQERVQLPYTINHTKLLWSPSYSKMFLCSSKVQRLRQFGYKMIKEPTQNFVFRIELFYKAFTFECYKLRLGFSLEKSLLGTRGFRWFVICDPLRLNGVKININTMCWCWIEETRNYGRWKLVTHHEVLGSHDTAAKFVLLFEI